VQPIADAGQSDPIRCLYLGLIIAPRGDIVSKKRPFVKKSSRFSPRQNRLCGASKMSRGVRPVRFHVEELESRTLPSFSFSGTYSVGETPQSVAVADVDGPGWRPMDPEQRNLI